MTVPAFAQPKAMTFDLSTETRWAEPMAQVPTVGTLLIIQENGRMVLKVDGSRWQEDQHTLEQPVSRG